MKRKRWFTSLSLCAFLVTAGSMTVLAESPEFARTPEEWARLRDNNLEYDELADLIHEYNTTVAANLVEYAKTRGKSIEEITNQYKYAAANYGNRAADAADDLSAIAAELAQRQAEIQADDTVDDGENDRLTYARAEALLVSQAQSLMNAYHQLLIKKEVEQSHKEYQERLLQSVTARQGNGTATAAEVLNAQQSVQASQANLINLDAQIEDKRLSLVVMTGWKADGKPEIKGMPPVDLNRIGNVDPVADKEKALQNDYSLMIAKRRLENAQTEDNKNLYSTNVKRTEESVRSAVDLGYQTMLQAHTAYEQTLIALTVANNNLSTGERKFQLGLMSQIDYIALQYRQQSAQASLRLSEMELLQAMESYDWLLNGLASS